jgi:trans-aconitate methyltransferase
VEEYRDWLREAGLEPVRVELIPKDVAHDRESLAGWVRTTWLPWTERVPAEEREEFIGEVVDAFVAAHPFDAQGKTHVPMVRLEVEARRPV